MPLNDRRHSCALCGRTEATQTQPSSAGPVPSIMPGTCGAGSSPHWRPRLRNTRFRKFGETRNKLMKQLITILAAAGFLAGCSPQDQGGTGTDKDTTTGTGYQVSGSGTAADTGLPATTNQAGANTNTQSGAGSQAQPPY